MIDREIDNTSQNSPEAGATRKCSHIHSSSIIHFIYYYQYFKPSYYFLSIDLFKYNQRGGMNLTFKTGISSML